jgi:hypothetical protein
MQELVKVRLKLGAPGPALKVEYTVSNNATRPIFVMTRATDIHAQPRPHQAYLGLEAERGALHAFLGKPPVPLDVEDGVEVVPFSCLLQPGDTFSDHLAIAAPVLDWDPYAEHDYSSSFPIAVVDTLVFSTEYFLPEQATVARKLADWPPYFLADSAVRTTIATSLPLPAPLPIMRVTDPGFQLPFPRHLDPSPPEEEQDDSEPVVLQRPGAPLPELPEAIPASVDAAPDVVAVPERIATFFREAWKASCKGKGTVQHGAVLARDAAGSLVVLNRTSGSADIVPLNRELAPGQQLVGIYHTRPHVSATGTHTGVSLSAADAVYLIKHGDRAIISQCGNEQFLFLRTLQTPAEADLAALAADHHKRMGQLLALGHTFSQASQEAAGALARAVQLAYYQGNQGVFRKMGAS